MSSKQNFGGLPKVIEQSDESFYNQRNSQIASINDLNFHFRSIGGVSSANGRDSMIDPLIKQHD